MNGEIVYMHDRSGDPPTPLCASGVLSGKACPAAFPSWLYEPSVQTAAGRLRPAVCCICVALGRSSGVGSRPTRFLIDLVPSNRVVIQQETSGFPRRR